MIKGRIAKRFPAGPESAEFTLDVEFHAAPGITVLFGPSGSGKTLTLDAIAGFVNPDSGRILLDDRILFDAAARVNVRPQLRNCGYVFQNYALFPHMSLRDNLAFAAGLRNSNSRLERHRRIGDMLHRFHLDQVAGRLPREVSGGEKQRCSIARALIGNPALLLLDEPARGLDAPLRTELYAVLREVRRDYNLPVLLVTHDLEESFEVADCMLIYREGRIVQRGSPLQIVERPAGVEVARLLGMVNVFQAEIAGLDPSRDSSRLRLPEFELKGRYFPGHLLGDRVWLYMRPDDLRVSAPNGSRPSVNQVPLKLARATEKPQSVRLDFSADVSVEISRAEFERHKHNKEWLVEFPPEAVRVL